jgi:hypothetical protein
MRYSNYSMRDFQSSILALLLVAAFSFGSQVKGQGLPLQEIEKLLLESTPLSKRQQFDDLQSAIPYWYESRNPVNIPAMDEALARVLPIAIKISPLIKDFTTWEEAQIVKPYHYAGSILLAKIYTLLYFSRIKEAAESIRLLEERLPYAMLLQRDRSVFWARKALRYHQHAIAIYNAITQQTLDKFTFPGERDEFDEPQQVQAIIEQVISRLQEGNWAAVEYFATAARKHQLRTTAGKWVENLIFDAMKPLSWESHSKGAWDEFEAAIREWQKRLPTSDNAALAQAAFHINHTGYLWYADKPYSDYRQDVEGALQIMKRHPTKTISWYTLKTRALIYTGRPLDEVMMCARENMIQYPNHAQPTLDAVILMAKGDDESVKTCGDFLRVLFQQPNKETPARVLNTLCRLELLDEVKMRLDLDEIDRAMRATGDDWSQSLSLRNEFAMLAVNLGLRDTARWMFTGIEEHWSHTVWHGKKDIVQQVISRPSDRKTHLKETASAVRFHAWLPPSAKIK